MNRASVGISVVVPVYNEEECLLEFYTRVKRILVPQKVISEIIFVNDGSNDKSLGILRNLRVTDPTVRIINIYRNSGHMNAIAVGLQHAMGEYVVTIDADLQDPPEYMQSLFEKIVEKDSSGKNRYDVVQTVRTDRSTDSRFKRQTAHLFYYIMRKVTKAPALSHAADYRIMNKSVVDILNQLPEQKKVFRFLIPELGFKIGITEIKRDARFAGKTKYGMRKMLSLAIDSAITYSYKPLRIASITGAIFGILLFGLAIGSAGLYLSGITIPGWASIVFLILGTNAILFAFLGLLGEYTSRIYDQLKNRPASVFEELEN